MKVKISNRHYPQMKPLQNDCKEKLVNREVFEQKHCIYAELKAYRKKHGLGCFKTVSDATDGKVAVGTIANMYTGTKVKNDTWILVGEALKKLKQEVG